MPSKVKYVLFVLFITLLMLSLASCGSSEDVPIYNNELDNREAIPDIEPYTRNYELGGLAYWYPGPSVAIFHSDHLEQTIVPVVTIGKINDDVSLFAEYEGSVSIEAKEK